MMIKQHWLTRVAGLATILALSACNEPQSPNKPNAPSTAAAPLLRQPTPNGAEVYFVTPSNGATVSNPVLVQFGLRNMGIAPAGVAQPDTGHHHLLIDTELAHMELPLPADDQHKHFGGGQTETTVTLTAGEHTLQLVLGDYLHIPHDPPVASERITINVVE